jgi:hypothetical protein
MPPRTRRAIAPQRSSPSPAPELRLQVDGAAHDSFDLDDVTDASGSDDADEPAQGYNLYVNNPDTIPTLAKSTTADIRFFFDRTGAKAICKVCR